LSSSVLEHGTLPHIGVVIYKKLTVESLEFSINLSKPYIQ